MLISSITNRPCGGSFVSWRIQMALAFNDSLSRHGMAFLTVLMLSLSSFVVSAVDAEPRSYMVTVSAGAHDRDQLPVVFPLPDALPDGVYVMESDEAGRAWLQVTENRGHFILAKLEAGQSVQYRFEAEPMAGSASARRVAARQDSSELTVTAEGSPVLTYIHSEQEPPEGVDTRYRRGGYIHPILTPEGVQVSRRFNPGRPHQYGIWSAWNRTLFQEREVEFWAAFEDAGRVEAGGLSAQWEGPVFGGFRSINRFVDASADLPVTAIHEQWDVVVYPSLSDGSWHLVDVKLHQTVGEGGPVHILQGGYGGLNVRGPDNWDGPGRMAFVTSEGENRAQAQGRPARWGHLQGDVAGQMAGIAVLAHPDNGGAAMGVFINQNNEPFFGLGPAALGSLVIGPGSPWTGRYRLVVHDGELDAGELERLWRDFAYPPAVVVQRAE